MYVSLEHPCILIISIGKSAFPSTQMSPETSNEKFQRAKYRFEKLNIDIVKSIISNSKVLFRRNSSRYDNQLVSPRETEGRGCKNQKNPTEKPKLFDSGVEIRNPCNPYMCT